MRKTITKSDIRKIIKECLSIISEQQMPKVLYHVSNPKFRENIMKQGLLPMVGDSYRAHYDDNENLRPVIFLKNTNDYDSTYDDDRWAIDTSELDSSCLLDDFDNHMAEQGCYVYTKPISPHSLHLIYKGSGNPL